MSNAKKVILAIFVLIVVLVVAVVVILPHFFNVDHYRPQVIARIRAETGKTAEIGRLSMTFFPTVAIRGKPVLRLWAKPGRTAFARPVS